MTDTSEGTEADGGAPAGPLHPGEGPSTLGRVSWALTAAGAAGSAWLATLGGTGALSGSLLLGIAALATLAVAVQATSGPAPGAREPREQPGGGDSRAGGEEPGAGEGVPEPEYAPEGPTRGHPLDLSERLAMGLLGGALGGLAVSAAMAVTGLLSLADLLGVDLALSLSPGAVGLRVLYGSLWGIGLGLFYRVVPGRAPFRRGAVFSLIPALYSLLVLYPLALDLGWLGLEMGALAFLFVFGYHLVWGVTAATLFQWAEAADLGLLSRPLVR